MSPVLASHLRSFLLTYLRDQRQLSAHTLKSYRDTFRLLVAYLSAHRRTSRPLTIGDLQVKIILIFLQHLEDKHHGRGNSPFTRNQRLAAIQSFFKYLLIHEPAHEVQAKRILAIPRKRTHRKPPEFLTRRELEAVLAQINLDTPDGVRDLAILAFLYNTGARAQEVSLAQSSWFDFPNRRVKITGKGGKLRITPLWPSTVQLLQRYHQHHRREPLPPAQDFFFINQRGGAFTRFGMRALVQKYVQRAIPKCPDLSERRISTHSLRHTTAVHLLKSKVELNVIKDWLGHASIKSTERYLQTDIEDKERILARFGPPDYVVSSLAPKDDDASDRLLDWLNDL